MAITVLKNCKIYIGGVDYSGHSNQLALSFGATLQNKTAFGATTIQNVAGLQNAGLAVSGHWNDDVDDDLHTSVGLNDQVITLCPLTGADGEVAYCMKGVNGQYQVGGSVGDILPFQINASASDDLCRGTIMFTGTDTASDTGTARQLGAVAAGQKVYASLHVLAASGTDPTLDVEIESDDASGMASATTQITFAQMTDVGAQLLTADGAITDDYWRVNYTIGGTDPSFTFVICVGIK